MKSITILALTLLSFSALSSSIPCEDAIDRVVGATGRYVTLRNSSMDADLVGAAQDEMFEAIEYAHNVCK